MHGLVTVDGLDHGWKPTKYSLLCLAHFEESCFVEDVSHRILSGSMSAETSAIFTHRSQSSKPRTFSVERAAKSERKILVNILVNY